METIVLLGSMIYVGMVGFWMISKVDFILQKNIGINPHESERDERE